MMRCLLPALAAIACSAAVPALAQQAEGEADGPFGEYARKLFPTEPLTAEEQARLPAARALAERLVPPGSYGAVMARSLQTTMVPVLRLASLSSIDTAFVQEQLGLPDERWEQVPRETRLKLAAEIDPRFGERARAGFDVLRAVTGEAFDALEPLLRRVVAEIHAQRFTQAQMEEISAFFATPTGMIYAEQWFDMTFDQRMMAFSVEIVPQLLPVMLQAEVRMKAAMDAVGERGRYANLPDAAKDRVAVLLELDRPALEAMMAASPPADPAP